MTEGREFWSAHLSAIDSAGITTKAYAQQHGLNVASLYYWRKRLKDNASGSEAASRFVPVHLSVSSAADRPATCSLVLAPGVRLELAQLPSVDWLAALGRALHGAAR